MREGLLNADLCLIPKPGKPPDKPGNLRPLGILRPDGKGLAGATRTALGQCITSSLQHLPQFAYLPGRGLSDALDRVVSHLREARDLIHTARPSRHEQHAGATLPDLAGGITFALDLSQAFDTVSRQSIIDNLAELGAPSEVVRLDHALHHRSKYRFQTQGESAWVETTAGIKQGCKLAPTLFSFLTGRLFTALADTFGVEPVVNFLTGYADDLTLHRTIRKVADLKAIHGLIAGLLEEVRVRRHSLVVNKSKCVILVKLVGR